MLSLTWPVVLAELGWVLMGIVDTVMVGPLGPAAIGAVGTGSTMFFAVMVLGIGTFFALDTFVAQNFGAGKIDECHRWLFAGVQLAAVLSVALVVVGLIGVSLLQYAGIHPDVIVILQPYLARLMWSAPALLTYTVLRRYLQAMNIVRPIMVGVVITNIINLVANWVFIYGHLGVPAMGAVGSAWATTCARVVLALYLGAVVLQRERRRSSGLHDVRFAWDGPRIWQLLRVGLPAAFQVTLEVGVFAVAAALAGRISPAALAANQVVLNVAGFFFMIPLGISSAAAVRVGQAVGRRDPHAVRRAGWLALAISAVVAAVVAVLYVTVPLGFLSLFSADPAVLGVGVSILLLYAIFQPFDSFQCVATGALRGLGDTRTPMLFNLVGHWFIGLPVAYMLCFWRGWGVMGLWVGLSLSVTLIGGSLVGVWHWRSRQFFDLGTGPAETGTRSSHKWVEQP